MYDHFYWKTWGNPTVYKKNGINLSTPTPLLSMHTIDSDFSLGEDVDGHPVMLANASIELFVSGGITRQAEFFGSYPHYPKPPHK